MVDPNQGLQDFKPGLCKAMQAPGAFGQ